jgi:hypothetical protein
MMVYKTMYKDKLNNENYIFSCDCGCQNEINVTVENDFKNLSFYINLLDVGFFGRVWNAFKYVFFRKTTCQFDIILNKSDMKIISDILYKKYKEWK